MGYYTYFQLETDGPGENADSMNVEYHEQKISERAGYAPMNVFEEHVKWYDQAQIMRAYSKEHPDVLFIVSGEGEEPGDLWKAYYKNGKMWSCDAEIVYPEFKEAYLK